MKFRSFEVERERDGWDDREEGNYMMGFVMYSYTLSSHVVSECTERGRFSREREGCRYVVPHSGGGTHAWS